MKWERRAFGVVPKAAREPETESERRARYMAYARARLLRPEWSDVGLTSRTSARAVATALRDMGIRRSD